MLKATIKAILAHKVRLAMTALAVVLGVSFMAGTFMLTDTVDHTFNTLFAQTAVGKDTTVQARSPYVSTGFSAGDTPASVPGGLVATVRAIPGVSAAAGIVQGYAQLVGPDGKAINGSGGAPSLGGNWVADAQLSSFPLRSGHAPLASDEIVVDAATVRSHQLHLGQRVSVLTAAAPRQFTIVGTVGFGSQDNLAGASYVLFDGPTAQQLLGQAGQWDSIVVAGARGLSAASLTERIASRLPASYEAILASTVAADTAKSVEKNFGSFTTFLLVFAGVALFVGGFIIYNTFSILVTQRTKELALFRALGASRRQVMRSVVIEAALLGLVASVLGLGAGVLLAFGLQALFRALGFGLPTSTLQVLPRTVIVSLAVGIVVTLISSIIPARRASLVAPVAALTDAVVSSSSSLRRRTTVGGSLLGAVGLALLSFGLFAHPAKAALLVGLSSCLVFIAVAMLSPVLVTPMARVLGAPLAALGGMTGRLSQQNAMRNPKRTASTAAALMVGVALVTVIATLGATVRSTLGRVIDQTIKADYIVSASGNGGDGFSPNVALALRRLPQLAAVSAGRQANFTLSSSSSASSASLVAVDPATVGSVLDFSMTGGSLASLAHGEVLVSTDAATSHHLRVGGTLAMGFDATGTQHLTVGGIYRPNDFVGSYVISLATYDHDYPKEPLDQLVFVKDRATPAASLAAIQSVVGRYPELQIQNQAQYKAAENNQIGSLLNLVYVLLAFSILIALIGIVNTLALSVIERTRELGLLRAVGMMRRQVRRMIRGEAVVVCLIGAVLGVTVGLGLGVALIAALHFSSGTILRIPGGKLAVVVVLAGLCGVLAAIAPARRASRLDVLAAIAA